MEEEEEEEERRRETINKASPRNVQEGGGRWGERKEGWESSDLTDLRKMERGDGQAHIHMEEVSASYFLHSPSVDSPLPSPC